MKSKQKLLVTTLLVLASVQISCIFEEPEHWDNLLGATMCGWSGGTWHTEIRDEEEVGYCEEPTPQAGSAEADGEPDKGQDMAGDPSDALACNATENLTWEDEILRDETNEFGTEICDYKIKFSSTQNQGAVWIMGYQHKADVWQGLDESEWVLLSTVEPGGAHEWLGYYNYYHDPDATGPSMVTLEKYAALFKDPKCEALLTEEEFLAWIAAESPVKCKE